MNHIRINIERYETNKKEILRDISFILNESDRVAIVGPNGAGKTTLLKILSGEITDYVGSIENCKPLSLGYLAQIHFDQEHLLVRDELKRAFREIESFEQKLKQLEQHMQENASDLDAISRYSEALETFNTIGGYTYEYEIHRVANGLGIVDLLDRSIREVSGWQRTKIALAKILLQKPDFLLLDEPTNFIDLAGTEWLEGYLASAWKGGYMIISHDRSFLDKTCQKTYELSGPRPLEFYNGNYTTYVREKAKKEKILIADFERQQEYIDEQEELINKYRAGSRAGWAKSREKMIDRMDRVDPPLTSKKPRFHFMYSEPNGDRMLYFKEAFIGRKDPLFYISELELHAGQRVGIVGENGVGKSTFLKTILGQIPLLDGFMSRGKWSKVSYYSQLHEELDRELTLRENFEKHGFHYSSERLTAVITRYLFERDDMNKKVKEFSGGQISKLLFAILGQKDSSFLIFDEPTNHLDYEFREALEQELEHYKGTILFISHDRYFINKIASHLWVIQNNELFVSYGNYDDYQYKKERGLSFDESLFDESAQLNFVLEDKLGAKEAKRIRDKYARKGR